ncbi:MAG: LytTR family DNA-binding domain-containing protein [Anaerolineaceae bacterium]|nr:LytTR family DNA-binding domain-containing protein [Anaerolineaceae bacterium]
MIRIAIVEDEEQCFLSLKKFLEQYSLKTGVLFSSVWFTNGFQFLSDYELNYDIVFMDIKMPQIDGMETSKRLRKVDPNVALVFITNLMQYAIKGYEVNALDFMVKPVNYFDFEIKLNKAIDYVNKHQEYGISIDIGDVKKKILISEIYYIEVLNHKLIYHTEHGNYETYGQLKKMEEELRIKNFSKCNNAYLINLRHVTELHPNHIVVGKDEVQVSRRKKKDFMAQLTNYMGGGL